MLEFSCQIFTLNVGRIRSDAETRRVVLMIVTMLQLCYYYESHPIKLFDRMFAGKLFYLVFGERFAYGYLERCTL